MPTLTPIENHIVGDVFTLPMWQEIQGDLNYLVQAGADLASAATIVPTNEFHIVTGVTTIDNFNHTAPVKGQPLRLLFTGAGLTIRNNGGGTGNIRTRSGADRPVATNEIVTFSYDGAVWREGSPAGGAPNLRQSSIAEIHASASQTVSTSTNTIMAADASAANTDGYTFPGGSVYQIQVPRTGYYRAGTEVTWAANATGFREIVFVHYNSSGTQIKTFAANNENSGSAADGIGQLSSAPISMLASERIAVLMWQNSGGNLVNPVGGAWQSQSLTLEYLGA